VGIEAIEVYRGSAAKFLYLCPFHCFYMLLGGPIGSSMLLDQTKKKDRLLAHQA